jgi:hypothetical protein
MNKNIYVKDEYRTNPLSLIPGGHEVTITYEDGFSQTYDKVKSPKAFVSKLRDHKKRKTKIIRVVVDGSLFTEY